MEVGKKKDTCLFLKPYHLLAVSNLRRLIFKVLNHENNSWNAPEYWSVSVFIRICVFPCLVLGLLKILVYVSPLSAFRDLYSAELVKMSPTGFPISVSISISTFGWVSPGLGALSIGRISDLLITILNCWLHWRYAEQGSQLILTLHPPATFI